MSKGGILGAGLLGNAALDFFSPPDPPDAPDYAGAAQQTAQGNLQLAQQNTEANRVNQYTPWGSLVYSQDANNPNRWTANVNLSPDQQRLFNANNASSLQMAGLLGMMGDKAGHNLWQNFDTSILPAQQVNPGQTAQDAIMARVQPYLDQRQEKLRTQLANQGVTQGSEAYNGSMDEFNRQANDAMMQAALNGIDVGQQARQQALSEAAFLRNEPLNELNALRTGTQVSAPQFNNVPQQQYTPGPNYLGAAQAQGQYDTDVFNMQQGYKNSMMNGLFSLGSMALMASDRRLKSNIVHVGTYNGHNVYEYDIFGRRERGVMAQEVMEKNPEAVVMHPAGYLMVDYSKI